MVSSYQGALDARTDLNQYESNKLLLFALQLKFQIEDIHTVAVDALTDGPDDKKCDLVYVDEEAGCIVVAQGYLSQDTTKTCAPGNKASDLNTAASWLLNRLVGDLPERLQSAVQGVRAALEAKSIRSIQFWYVHNLPESGTIKNEMSTVEQTIYSSINSSFPALDTNEITIAAIEIGKNTLDEWYRTLETPILVSQELKYQ